MARPSGAAGTPMPAEVGGTSAPQVPAHRDFLRSFDVEGYLERMNRQGEGAQALRLRTRYLDPDVNAFVGFVTEAYHFNEDLRIGEPSAPDTAGAMWNWGIDLGLQRRRTLWELDVMGSLLSAAVGPAVAFEGDHALSRRWGLYHRTEFYFYLQDKDEIFDSDQGAFWRMGNWRITAGYRIFAGKHMNRSGLRLGVSWTFESPKIPFIFPSLG